MRLVYPLVVLAARISGKSNTMIRNEKEIPPAVPVYEQPVVMNNGTSDTLAKYRGKKIVTSSIVIWPIDHEIIIRYCF